VSGSGAAFAPEGAPRLDPAHSPLPFLSPLALLDAVIPKDSGTTRIARGLAYGPHPRHRLDLYAPLVLSRKAGKGDHAKRGGGGGPTHSDRLPVLLFVYGGGWDSGRREEYSFAGRAFAALGFLCAVVDHRIVPEVQFPAFVDDIGLAASWLIAHAAEHSGDPSRIVFAGQSSGAYNAVTVALAPARFGAPDLAGRLKGVVGLAGPYDFYPFDVKQSIRAFEGIPDPEQSQPINLVTSAAPPMFLAHGDKDTTVGPYHTVRLAKKLRENGVRVVEKQYPDLAHAGIVLALMHPFRTRNALYRDIVAFLRSVV
jgi:acetyl esterase/lipase